MKVETACDIDHGPKDDDNDFGDVIDENYDNDDDKYLLNILIYWFYIDIYLISILFTQTFIKLNIHSVIFTIL